MSSKYHHLTAADRYTICAMRKSKYSQRQIAKVLGVHVSTISRELQRNTSFHGYRFAFAERYNPLAELCIARLNNEHTDFSEPWVRGFVCIMGIPHYPHPEGTEQVQREFQALTELTGEKLAPLMARYHGLEEE